jgi:hypothetical protein
MEILTTESAESVEMKQNEDGITGAVIGAAMAVHRELGPGLLESAYEACLAYELANGNLKVQRQKSMPVTYHDVQDIRLLQNGIRRLSENSR